MGNPATTPMLSPDGQVGDIPSERVHEAVQGGFKLAQEMIAPDGSHGVIPLDAVHDAIKKGFQLKPPGVQPPPNPITTPAKQQRYSDIVGPNGGPGAPGEAEAATGNVNMGAMAIGALKAVGQNVQGAAEIATPLGIPALAAQLTGKTNPVDAALQPSNEDQQSGATSTNDAIMASGALGLPELAEGVAGVLGKDARIASKVRVAVPEARALPDKAVGAGERIIKAAAPTGTQSEFRTTTYKALPDLKEVGQELGDKLSKAAGGIDTPDMRARTVVNAIDEHLDKMYKEERLGVIQQAPKAPVPVDAVKNQPGLQYMAKTAGDPEVRAMAGRTLSGRTLSLEQADKLAQAVNHELRAFENAPPDTQATLKATNPNINGLKGLDRELSARINGTLETRGLPQLKDYEERYAALSRVRDQLDRRINNTELQQPGLVKKATQTVRSVTGGVKNLAGASASAVSDVNMGKQLEKAFEMLKDTDITPKRPTPPRPNMVLSGGRAPELAPSQRAMPLSGGVSQSGPTAAKDSAVSTEPFSLSSDQQPPELQRPLPFSKGVPYPGKKK